MNRCPLVQRGNRRIWRFYVALCFYYQHANLLALSCTHYLTIISYMLTTICTKRDTIETGLNTDTPPTISVIIETFVIMKFYYFNFMRVGQRLSVLEAASASLIILVFTFGLMPLGKARINLFIQTFIIMKFSFF